MFAKNCLKANIMKLKNIAFFLTDLRYEYISSYIVWIFNPFTLISVWWIENMNDSNNTFFKTSIELWPHSRGQSIGLRIDAGM